jgi:hypothetical protein
VLEVARISVEILIFERYGGNFRAAGFKKRICGRLQTACNASAGLSQGKTVVGRKKQIPSLRYGMTNKEATE